MKRTKDGVMDKMKGGGGLKVTKPGKDMWCKIQEIFLHMVDVALVVEHVATRLNKYF